MTCSIRSSRCSRAALFGVLLIGHPALTVEETKLDGTSELNIYSVDGLRPLACLPADETPAAAVGLMNDSISFMERPRISTLSL